MDVKYLERHTVVRLTMADIDESGMVKYQKDSKGVVPLEIPVGHIETARDLLEELCTVALGVPFKWSQAGEFRLQWDGGSCELDRYRVFITDEDGEYYEGIDSKVAIQVCLSRECEVLSFDFVIYAKDDEDED